MKINQYCQYSHELQHGTLNHHTMTRYVDDATHINSVISNSLAKTVKLSFYTDCNSRSKIKGQVIPTTCSGSQHVCF